MIGAPVLANTGVSDARVSLPDGPGSIGGLGQSADVAANLGSMSYAVPLAAPAGFDGATPSLALTYSSLAGNADVGIGWELSVPSIERYTLRGLPTYDTSDVFAVNGSEELVRVGGTDGALTYRARFEGGFARTTWHADPTGARGYFEVEYPDGSRGFFGADEHGNPVESAQLSRDGQVFRYLLVVTLDRFGHAVRYDYDKLGGDYPLLREVSYLFTQGAPRYRIQLDYAARADHISRADMGFEVVLDRRLSQVRVLSGDTPLRTYDLDYEETNTGMSRLVRVQQRGLGGELFPVVFSFAYTQSLAVGCVDCDRPFLTDMASLEAGASGGVDLQNGQATLIDINGDSLPDVLDTGRTGQHRFFLNTMNAADGTQQFAPGVVSTSAATGFHLSEPGVQVVDVNGDGFTDMIHTVANRVLCNRGSGDWSAASDCAGSVSIDGLAPDEAGDADPLRIRFLDYDGDRRIDLIRTAGPSTTTVIRNTPDGFVEETVEAIGAEFDASPLQLGDINGDGLLDPVEITNGGAVNHRLNLGYGRWSPWREQVLEGATSQELEEADLQDLNGDGLDDIVIVQGNTVKISLNHAGRFLPFATLVPGDVDGGLPTRTDSTSVLFADMNGSGTTDIVWITSDGHVQFLEMYAIRPNLLTRIDNGIGGVEHVEYGTSAREQARDEQQNMPWRHRLPQAMNVVTATESYTTLSSDRISRREMRYHHGLYDGREKRYRGFEQVEQHDLADMARDGQDSGLTILDFDVGGSQRPHRAGLLLRQQVFGGAGDSRYLVRSQVHEYDDCPLADVPSAGLRLPVRYACKVASETVLQEGRPAAEWVTLRHTQRYDGYGNVTLATNHGVVGMGRGGDAGCGACTAPDGTRSGACGAQCLGDEAYIETEYIAPGEATDGAWLLGQPSRAIRYGREGGPYTETLVYYDGQPFTGLARGTLTRGLATRICKRATPDAAPDCEGEGWVVAERARYDGDGNVVETLDPLAAVGDDTGHRTRTEYDAYNLKPAAVEMLLSDADGPYRLRREVTYDPVFYQPASSTRWMLVGAPQSPDPAPTHVSYDAFGRRSTVVKPGDSVQAPTLAFRYELAAPVSRVVTQSRSQSGQPLDQEQQVCFDGFGRAVQTRTRLDANRFHVTGVTELNRRGLPVRAYQAYESGASGCDQVVPAGVRYASFRYDALGRPVLSELPDQALYGQASTTRTTYAPLVTIERDAEDTDPTSPHHNTPTVRRVDGLGSVVAIERYLAVDRPVATSFHYDSLGRLHGYRDPAGHIKAQRYDLLDRLLEVDDPNAGTTTYGYDAAGNQIRKRDARGVVVRTAFDGANRPVAQWDERDPEGTRVTLRYDRPATCPADRCTNAAGRLVETRYPVDLGDGASVGRDQFGFDTRGRPIYQARVLRGHELSTTRVFDNADRAVSTTYPDGQILARSYDGASRITGIDGILDDARYGERGQLERMTYANGVTTTRVHDDRQRLSELVTLDRDGGVLQGFAYSRDRVGNITAIEDLGIDGAGDARYTYDAGYRLVDATLGRTEPEALSFIYDEIDNIMSATSSLGPRSAAHVGAYAYDAAHPNAAVRVGGRTDVIDAAGYVTGRGTMTLDWDHLGRQSRVSADDRDVARFAYGPSHERVAKREGASEWLYIAPEFEVRDGISVLYVRVGRTRIARLQSDALAAALLSDLAPLDDTDGQINVGDAWVAHASAAGILDTRDATLSPPDRLLAASARRLLMEASPGPRFLHGDHLGSLTLATDGDAAIRGSRSYYPFGARRAERGDVDSYGFTGQERDAGTGLLRFQFRHLDTTTGRWLSPDPLFATVSPDSLARPEELGAAYAYVGNNATNLVDPLGLARYVPGPRARVAVPAGLAGQLAVLHQRHPFDVAARTAIQRLADTPRTSRTTGQTQRAGLVAPRTVVRDVTRALVLSPNGTGYSVGALQAYAARLAGGRAGLENSRRLAEINFLRAGLGGPAVARRMAERDLQRATIALRLNRANEAVANALLQRANLTVAGVHQHLEALQRGID